MVQSWGAVAQVRFLSKFHQPFRLCPTLQKSDCTLSVVRQHVKQTERPMPWLKDLSPRRHGRHGHLPPGTLQIVQMYFLGRLSSLSSLPSLSSLSLLRTMVLTHIAVALLKERGSAGYIAVFCVSRVGKRTRKLPVAWRIKHPISSNNHKNCLGIPQHVLLMRALIHQPTFVPMWRIRASL